MHTEAPAILERTREAPNYVRTDTIENFPSFVGQAHQKLNRKLNSAAKAGLKNDTTPIITSQYQSNLQSGHNDDVYLHNQYNLLSPDVLERIPTKTSLTRTQSSVSTSLHGSIAHTPPLSPNGDSLIQAVELNLPIPQIQGSFMQTPPETPLSIVFQYRNSKVKVPSEPVTPLQQAPNTTQHSNYFSLPTLHPVPSRTYPSLPQTDLAQNTFAQVPRTNDTIYKVNRSTHRAADTIKEIKRQLSEDEADELIAHVETYLSGTEALDGDKDYIIMVKKSSDGTTADNIVICREVDSHSDVRSEEQNLIDVSNKGAIKKQLQVSYSDPAFKESTCREKIKKTFTERSISQIADRDEKQYYRSNVQKLKHLPIHPLLQASSAHSSTYRIHKNKDIDTSIEEENDNQVRNRSAQVKQSDRVIYLNPIRDSNQSPDLSYREECSLGEETSAVLEIKITESDSGLTPSSEESEGGTRSESIFPGYFPVYRDWSASTEDRKFDPGGELLILNC